MNAATSGLDLNVDVFAHTAHSTIQRTNSAHVHPAMYVARGYVVASEARTSISAPAKRSRFSFNFVKLCSRVNSHTDVPHRAEQTFPRHSH